MAMSAAVDCHQVIAGIRVEIETLHSPLEAQYRRDARADDRLRHFTEVQWTFGF
jgi:chloramphenicol 3-O-phosphotransferase